MTGDDDDDEGEGGDDKTGVYNELREKIVLSQ